MRKRVFTPRPQVCFLLFRFFFSQIWSGTQEAIRGRFAKPLGWVFRCEGSNPSRSAKYGGVAQSGLVHLSRKQETLRGPWVRIPPPPPQTHTAIILLELIQLNWQSICLENKLQLVRVQQFILLRLAYAPIAQLVEQYTSNVQVVSSSLTRSSKRVTQRKTLSLSQYKNPHGLHRTRGHMPLVRDARECEGLADR